MFFPIRSEQPAIRAPAITFLLIAVNFGAFLLQISGGDAEFERSIFAYGLVPARLAGADLVYHFADEATSPDGRTELVAIIDGSTGAEIEGDLSPPPPNTSDAPDSLAQRRRSGVAIIPVRPAPPFVLSILTAIFMHAGWMHLLGNLWFFWLFGVAVEDAFGRVRFLAFYLGTGILAAAAHVAGEPRSALPCVGASGAISGVMGGYLLLFPRSRILALGPLSLVRLIPIPAYVFLGLYLAEQVWMSLAEGRGGGTAWWAHIGGFVAGLVIAKAMPQRPGRAFASGPRRSSKGRFTYE